MEAYKINTINSLLLMFVFFLIYFVLCIKHLWHLSLLSRVAIDERTIINQCPLPDITFILIPNFGIFNQTLYTFGLLLMAALLEF